MDWNFRNDQPIYSQLTQRLTERHRLRHLRAGRKLLRARACGGSGRQPNTVQRALSELERDGLVFSQRTAGTVRHGNENMIAMPSSALRTSAWENFSTR